MKNLDKPIVPNEPQGRFFTTEDGVKLFVYEHRPSDHFLRDIFIIYGVTGINHESENDIIELLSNNKNRVVVPHPRGIGYSEG